jgi:hypothetical protein
MTTNPYEPPNEITDVVAIEPRVSAFWKVFAFVFLVILVVDAILSRSLYPFNEAQRVEAFVAWLLVNLPGLPVAFFTARRTYGEPLRFLVKSAGIAAIHWATIAGTVAQLYRGRRKRHLSTKELIFIVLLNLLVPLLLVYLMSFYEWEEESPD